MTNRYRKKPVVIIANQWFKNGDHPLDNSWMMKAGTPEESLSEGNIVKHYRTEIGQDGCQQCGWVMQDHGWIDTLEGGHIVCPGDWIIKGVKGERYPCKPDIFEMTYEKVPDD